jgi:glycosyltransferase involved in cell wall biosynthesis
MVSTRQEWGGIEQYAKYLAQGLRDNGHRVCVVARDVDYVVKSYKEICDVYTFPIRSSIDAQSIVGIAKLVRENSVDIIHTHTSRDAWTAFFATLLAGRGKVVTTRHVPLAAKRDILHKFYYSRLAAIFCVSQYVRNIFLGERPVVDDGRVHVVHPGIDVKRFAAVQSGAIRDKLGLKADDFIIGYVGRITRDKGLDDFIQALAEIKAKRIGFHAVLVGDVNPRTPDYATELRNAAQLGGVSDRVHFWGFSQDIAAIMHDLDVLVLPSTIPETFGMVLCEAMACGKPVVSTTTGAQVEIIQNGANGLLVPPRSPESLAYALEKLIADREQAKRMGLRGKMDVSEHFSLERMVSNIERCYERSLLGQ